LIFEDVKDKEGRGKERKVKNMLPDVVDTHLKLGENLEFGDEVGPNAEEGIRGVRNGFEVYLASTADSGTGETDCV
jgi:hypothetical protein